MKVDMSMMSLGPQDAGINVPDSPDWIEAPWGDYCLIEQHETFGARLVRLDREDMIPPAIYPDVSRVIFVFDFGRLEIQVEGETWRGGCGSCYIIAPGRQHSIKALGDVVKFTEVLLGSNWQQVLEHEMAAVVDTVARPAWTGGYSTPPGAQMTTGGNAIAVFEH